MELYQEMLAQMTATHNYAITFRKEAIDAKEAVESRAYQALKRIHAILSDDTLDDADCFTKIEQITDV